MCTQATSKQACQLTVAGACSRAPLTVADRMPLLAAFLVLLQLCDQGTLWHLIQDWGSLPVDKVSLDRALLAIRLLC
jgi:hypothetical protein